MFWPMSLIFKALKVMPVDRSDAGDVGDKVAGEFIKRDKFIPVIFPEGTRTETGKMKPFKAGAKMVADKFALKVQPVVLIATAWHFSNKRKDFRPGTVTAVYLDSFVADKNDPDWLNNLHNTMQKVYDDELANHPRYR